MFDKNVSLKDIKDADEKVQRGDATKHCIFLLSCTNAVDTISQYKRQTCCLSRCRRLW